MLISYTRLSKSRRKRPVPEDWATTETIEKFGVASTSKALFPGSTSVAVDDAGKVVLSGGSDGTVGVYSISGHKIQKSFNAGSAVTDALWYGTQPVVSTSSGAVKVLGNEEITFTSHAGSANGLALHPSGDILASVGVDKSFVFYDLVGGSSVMQVYTDSGMHGFVYTSKLTLADQIFRSHHGCVSPRWASICRRGGRRSNQALPCQDRRERSKFRVRRTSPRHLIL